MMALFYTRISRFPRTRNGPNVIGSGPWVDFIRGESESDHGSSFDGIRKELQTALTVGDVQIAADRALAMISGQACSDKGIIFKKMSPIQRLFITRYRCPKCGLLPLYRLIAGNAKRTRCGGCGELIRFRSTGKYGRIRKRIVFSMLDGNQTIIPLLRTFLSNQNLEFRRNLLYH